MAPTQENRELEFQRAEYQEAGQMARLYAGYRLNMFDYYATLTPIVAGATYTAVYIWGQPILGLIVATVGFLVSVIAIAIEQRTYDLHTICEVHASKVEQYWRQRGQITPSDA